MKSFFTVAALASVAFAQIPNVPSCGLNCFVSALTGDGCSSLTDFACHCGKGAELTDKIQPCVLQACTNPSDVQAIASTVESQCAAVGSPVTISTPASLAASATSVASSAASQASSKASSASSAITSAASSAKSAASSALSSAAGGAKTSSAVRATTSGVRATSSGGSRTTSSGASQFTGEANHVVGGVAGAFAAGLAVVAAL